MKTKTLLLIGLTIGLAFVTFTPVAAAEDCTLGLNAAPCAVRCILNGEKPIDDCATDWFHCPPWC